MRIHPILTGLLAGTLLCPAAFPQHLPPSFRQVILPCPGLITDVRIIDIDGNGLADIAASHTLTRNLPRAQRGLSFFLQDSTGGSFSSRLRIDPGRDCLLWDIADIDADGKAELLLLKSDGIYISSYRSEGFPHSDLIVKEASLIPAAAETLPRYPLALPVQETGECLILLPSSGMVKLYRREGRGYRAGGQLFWRTPLSFSAASELSCTMELPVLESGRFNRDADPDIMLISGTTLSVFLAAHGPNSGGSALTIADKRYLLDSRAISPSVFEDLLPEMTRIETVDLDRDGYSDVVLSKSPRARFRTGISQVQIFLNRNGRIGRLPDQILTADHFSGDHIITDLNGDGLQDIALLAFPLGFTQAARVLLSKKTANRYELFFMRPGGSYPALPDETVSFTRSVDLHNPLDEAPLRSFSYDFSGDGRADFLVAADPDRFTVFTGTGKGRFSKKERFRIAAPTGGSMGIHDLNRDGVADLVLWGNSDPARRQTITLLISGPGVTR